MAALNFPSNPVLNDVYVANGKTWIWDGTSWTNTSTEGPIGFTGSAGIGFTGSAGDIGYTGSAGDIGYTGSAGAGFTGSAGDIGYTGSAGAGFTGSAGDTGFTGSAGELGYTGSAGDTGFTGSAGAGFTGSAGDIGFTGSAGDIGFTGSAGEGVSILSIQGDTGGVSNVDLGTQTLSVTGSTNISTVSSNQSITVNLNNSLTGITQANIGDLFISNNSISVTAVDQDLILQPNGNGKVVLGEQLVGSGEAIIAADGTDPLYLKSNANVYIVSGATNTWTFSDTGSLVKPDGNVFTGEAGFTGSQGDIGFTGSTGFVGSQGDIGFTGSLGYTGSQGDIGFTGSTGFVGSQGDIGFTGSAGDVSTVGVGGTYTFTANGNISAGEVVVLNNDGTVSIVTEAPASFGTQTSFASASSIGWFNGVYGSYSSTGDIVLIAYADSTENIYVKAGTVSGTTITFGAEVNVGNAVNRQSLSFAANAQDHNFIINYQDNSSNHHLVAGTVSGTTVTLGTTTVISANLTYADYLNSSACYVPSTNSYLITWSNRLSASSTTFDIIPVEVSGTTTTLGTKLFDTGYGAYPNFSDLSYDSFTNQVVLHTAQNEFTLLTMPTSSTVSKLNRINAATSVGTSGRSPAVAFDGKGNAVFTVRSSAVCFYIVANISSGSLVLHQPISYSSGTTNQVANGVGYNPVDDKFILMYYQPSSWYFYSCDLVTNDTLLLSSPTVYSDGSLLSGTTLLFPARSIHNYTDDSDIFLYYVPASTNSLYRIAPELTGSTKDDAIGVAEETVANAQQVGVTILGGINEQVTGLTTNRYYVVSFDGTLVETTDPNTAFGRSLATNKLLIKK